jgi:hypothetical protein
MAKGLLNSFLLKKISEDTEIFLIGEINDTRRELLTCY